MLEWYVFVADFNSKKIKKYNIFDHWSFREDCRKTAKKKEITKKEFCEEIRSSLMYYFWAKCEWEMLLNDFPPHESFNQKKVNVYEQVMLNHEVFFNYLWDHRKDLAKKDEE